MKKLTQLKIQWIIREMKKGQLSVYQIAKQQKVSQRWVRELYKQYMKTGEYPYPKKPGRKIIPITDEERKTVLELRKEHPLCACTLELILDERDNHIPHNRIHNILRESGISREEPKKSRRRKWIRYQRRHSNSLWHTDWFKPRNGHLIVMEDDASRFITGYDIFNRESSENAASLFTQSVGQCGKPKQLMSDHGTTFTSLPRTSCPDPSPNMFQKALEESGSEHIMARIKHPQSNGKVERIFQTLVPLMKHFGSWEAAVEYYNYRRPHMSLNNGSLRTPHQAFLDKQRKNRRS
jgi:putative transposase